MRTTGDDRPSSTPQALPRHPYTGRQFVRINLEADEPGPVSFDPELPKI
jgi:hypothetical protein